MSTDGRIVVGTRGDFREAFRWSEETGLRLLPRLANGGGNEAFSISDNGRVIAGRGDGGYAVIWVDGGQPRLLGDLSERNVAYDVSSGGEFVVGSSGPRSGAFRDEAFVWSESTGIVTLGDLPGGEHWSAGIAVAADGRTVVGFSKDGSVGGGVYAGFSAVLWTPGLGMRSVKTELESYGIDLTGWYLTGATGVINDGLTIVGRGVNPRGFEEAWIATIPEPSTVGLLLTALASLLLGLRGRRR